MHLKKINACVLIPTYNNDKTLRRVIVGVLEYCAPEDVIVINDGATDQTEIILQEFEADITVLRNESNRGKGYSLRKGFREAIARGYSNAISIDSDGQHLPGDLPVFVNGALENPGALLMGARNMDQEGVPSKSSFGNKFSNFWFWFETGIQLPDTQTGYRLYPLDPLKRIRLFTNKFETEIEVIVKMAWRNVPIVPVDIRVIYDKDERVTRLYAH
jgi:glycosyltransferase involved in cell wall biosynthesis